MTKAASRASRKPETAPVAINNFAVVEGIGNIRKLNGQAIAGFAKSRIKLHQALFASVYHAMRFQDTTLVTELWNGLGNEVNKRNGIGVWLEAFTNLKQRKAKDGTMQWLKPKDETSVAFKVEEAKAMPFWDMPGVDKKNSEMPNLLNAMGALFSKFSKLDKDNKLSTVDHARLAWMKAAAERFSKDIAPTLKAELTTEVPFEETAPANA